MSEIIFSEIITGSTKAARYVKLELRIDFFDEFMASLP